MYFSYAISLQVLAPETLPDKTSRVLQALQLALTVFSAVPPIAATNFRVSLRLCSNLCKNS